MVLVVLLSVACMTNQYATLDIVLMCYSIMCRALGGWEGGYVCVCV